MRAIKRLKARGFTLVELMIVVAIIGVLAALAIFGVRKYLAAAKSAEARNTIGAVNRASVAAYERENMPSELLGEGATSQTGSHALCTSAEAVPAGAVPAGKKYQPKTGATEDFNSGSATSGWKCLRFGMTEPHYYQYKYDYQSASLVGNGPSGKGEWWSSQAKGDLNGDGVFSGFKGLGEIRNGQPVVSTVIFEENPDELSFG